MREGAAVAGTGGGSGRGEGTQTLPATAVACENAEAEARAVHHQLQRHAPHAREARTGAERAVDAGAAVAGQGVGEVRAAAVPPSVAPRHFRVRVDNIGDNSTDDKWQSLSFYNKAAIFIISGKTYIIKSLPQKGQKDDEVIFHHFDTRHILTFESQTAAADFLTEATNRYSNKRPTAHRRQQAL